LKNIAKSTGKVHHSWSPAYLLLEAEQKQVSRGDLSAAGVAQGHREYKGNFTTKGTKEL